MTHLDLQPEVEARLAMQARARGLALDSYLEALLDRIAAGEQAIVPAHWLTEVSNGLLMATRRKRIDRPRAEQLLDKLAALRIAIEPPLSVKQARAIFALSITHKLTFYDATYLDLALRTSLPLATLDSALIGAARQERVAIFL